MYKVNFWIASVILFITSILTGCSNTTDSANLATVTGFVYYYDSAKNLKPLTGALITSVDVYQQTVTTTDGSYSFAFDITNDQEISFQASKAGFYSIDFKTPAKKGQQFRAPDITMTAQNADSGTTSSGTASGDAAHITILPNQPDHIYVYASGLRESAPINFMVTDDKGNPLDNEHKIKVYFKILNGPNGGEYLYPDTMTTVNGLVSTTLNSGLKAGAVQLEVYFSNNDRVVHSTPVRFSIYGGLPDASHFSVSAEKINIAGQVHFGIVDNIVAFVGDKYSNPVAPGTVVYFSSNLGIIDGSALTDEMGRATVPFMTAAPLPSDPASNSLATITTSTYGDTTNTQALSASVDVLLSSVTGAIRVTPNTFQYDSLNTALSFNYNVSDVYGNPLVAASRITVEATDGTLYGDTDFKLLDSRSAGNGTTDFSFSWAPGDSLAAPQVYISIKVITPVSGNGNRSIQILGTKKK